MSTKLADAVLLKCKLEYISAENTPIYQIAKQNNVNDKTLQNYATKEGWTELRKKSNSTREKILLGEIETKLPQALVKDARTVLLRQLLPAIETIREIMNGKAGKGAYNKLLAAKWICETNGIKPDDNINLKISKIMDSIESMSVTVSTPDIHSPAQELSTGNPESYPQLDNKVINNSDKIHYVNKNENKDNISKDNTSSTTTPSSEVIHSHKAELSTGENIPQSGPIPGASEVPVAGQAVDCAPAGNAETGIGEGEGSITNIPSVTDIKKEE